MRGGHRPLERAQVAAWWDRYDALIARTAQLKQEKQRTAAREAAEALPQVLDRIEDDAPSRIWAQLETATAALEQAVKAKAAANVFEKAQARFDAIGRALADMDDEDAAVLLLT